MHVEPVPNSLKKRICTNTKLGLFTCFFFTACFSFCYPSLPTSMSQDYVELCSHVLQWHCAANDNAQTSPLRTSFHSCRVPPISISDYVSRIQRYSKCSPECLVLALVYIDRFLRETKTSLSFFNAHRLILIAVMVAAKLRDDIYYSNGYYGHIGGIPREEVNKLELTFLTTCDWTLWVDPELFRAYVQNSMRKIQLKPTPLGAGLPIPAQCLAPFSVPSRNAHFVDR